MKNRYNFPSKRELAIEEIMGADELRVLGRKRTSWARRNRLYIILWSVLLAAFATALWADKASGILNQGYLIQ